MLNLLDLTTEDMQQYVTGLGYPKYRAAQVRKWLYEGVPFEEMSDLPSEMRAKLASECEQPSLEIKAKLESKLDETKKYLFAVGGGNIIESVLMRYKYGWSACISSQIGCRMGCRFCASSGIGFVGDLTAGQMLGQIISMNRDNGIRIGHVVIMGIGEPMDNYDNVVSFLKKATAEDGLGISARHISLSTCGVVPGIEKLANEGLPVTLSVSLHAPSDDIRSSMMPINNKYSIDKLLNACNSYVGVTGRRITFEYSLISGVNDSKEHALMLARKLKGMLCHVNLIPVNKIENGVYTRPDRKTIDAFAEVLNGAGISATVRRELGRDIDAACGQLRRTLIEQAANNNEGSGK
ncbi:MAG: 23S rRNA (adenine(2503)-C(2))-methyltransferase RlmN [Clostridia bacterium]|nr:23S rRNA (adenine(2503)-C(2))-methyltransferase RlmN [Clostridia bacterium]